MDVQSNGFDISWVNGDMKMFLPLMLTLVGFSVFWFISKSPKINDGTVNNVLLSKFVGFVSMGVLPAAVSLWLLPEYSLADYGWTYSSETMGLTVIATLVVCAVTMPLAFYSTTKEKNLVNYPQIRKSEWDRSLIVKNIIGWTFYLVGYEFLFRGILLFPVVDIVGVWPAIAINTAMYSATHIPKGMDEAIGAAPLGIVLCLITLLTGTLWVAIIVHIAMALTNSFGSVRHNKDMKFV